MKLTDTQLRRWRPKKRSELLDGNGLILRASPNGKRTWTVRYRFNGKRHRIEVGSYPDMSLAEARAKLAEIKIDIAAGHDPQLARLEDAVTFPEVYRSSSSRRAAAATVPKTPSVTVGCHPFS